MAWIPAALSAASLAAGLFGKKRKPPKPQMIDITGELAKIGEMYAAMRQQQTSELGREQAGAMRQTAESLAARGIYRSPISQYAQQETRKTYATALSDALARLNAEEAAQRINLSTAARTANINAMNEYERAKNERAMANQAMIQQGLVSLGSYGLQKYGGDLASLFQSRATPTASPYFQNPNLNIRTF